jgi:predicted permease
VLAAFVHDLRSAARGMLRAPGFALTAVLMLAAGLGACLYVYGVIQSFLVRDLPFADPARLLHVELTSASAADNGVEVRLRDFATLEREQTMLAPIAAFYQGTVNLSGDAARAERFDGAYIGAAAFEALRTPAALGRALAPADEAPGAPPVVLLGWDLWQQRYGGDPSVLGRTIRANGRAATVVGVMPQGFRFPLAEQVWLPLARDTETIARMQGTTVEVFGRLREGADLAAAQAEMDALVARLNEAHPGDVGGDRAVVKRYREEFLGTSTRQILATMAAAVLLVLLIACANVANLLLVRAARRARDTAVRSAIGASRGRLVAGLVAESVLLALLAVPIAVAGAHWAGTATMASMRTNPDAPPLWMTEWSLAPGFIALAFALALATGMLAGVLPAWRLWRSSAAQVIREAGNALSPRGAGRALVVAEVAMSLALLVAAGLVVRAVLDVGAIDPGARTERMLTARIGAFEGAYPDDAAVRGLHARLQEELRAIPGAEGAALTTALPMGTSAAVTAVVAEGEAVPDPQHAPLAFQVDVDGGYFDLFAVPVLAGRGFDARDGADTLPVVVVSRALAERHWPGQDPLGRRIRIGRVDDASAPLYTVVGVVGDVVQNASAVVHGWGVAWPNVYRPLTQSPARFVSIALATPAAPEAFAEALRAAVQRADADTPVYWVRSLRSWIDAAATDHRLVGTIFGLFGAFSVLLAATGLYAVLAYSVAQRTREIGVRRALGAADRGILRLVMGQGLRQILLGLGIGLVLAVGFGAALGGILHGVSGADPLVYGGALVLFTTVALVACLAPARRALRVEPMQALRYD